MIRADLELLYVVTAYIMRVLVPVAPYSRHPLLAVLHDEVPGEVGERAVVLHVLDVRHPAYIKRGVLGVVPAVELHGDEAALLTGLAPVGGLT